MFIAPQSLMERRLTPSLADTTTTRRSTSRDTGATIAASITHTAAKSEMRP